jgi:hypothetical protein
VAETDRLDAVDSTLRCGVLLRACGSSSGGQDCRAGVAAGELGRTGGENPGDGNGAWVLLRAPRSGNWYCSAVHARRDVIAAFPAHSTHSSSSATTAMGWSTPLRRCVYKQQRLPRHPRAPQVVMNMRPPQLIIDPSIDLLTAPWPVFPGAASWITCVRRGARHDC